MKALTNHESRRYYSNLSNLRQSQQRQQAAETRVVATNGQVSQARFSRIMYDNVCCYQDHSRRCPKFLCYFTASVGTSWLGGRPFASNQQHVKRCRTLLSEIPATSTRCRKASHSEDTAKAFIHSALAENTFLLRIVSSAFFAAHS